MADVAEQIDVWDGTPPGSEGWSHERIEEPPEPPFDFLMVRNVVRPVMHPYLPEKPTGAAAVVCPGGAFHFLNLDYEGTEVARWLSGRGIAAFVLEYRVAPTPADRQEFMAQLGARTSDRAKMAEIMSWVAGLGEEDARRAVAIVRERAPGWGLDPSRVGLLGFSAGGRVTSGVALRHDEATRPAFAGFIYGVHWEDIAVPEDAPPLFALVAQDDEIAIDSCLRLFGAWRDAGKSAELHVFSRGGHGFSMRRQGLPCDDWIELFYQWLRAEQITS